MKHFRKLLAVLLAAMMLCSILPLSALVSAADENILVNGDFEAGTSNWTLYNDDDTATEVIDDPTGSGRGKVMHTASTYNNSNGRDDMFYQAVTLEQNTDYVLTLKAYCYSTASNAAFIVNWYDKTNGQKVTYNTEDVVGLACQNIDSSSAVRCRLNVQSNTGKWVDVTIPFNSSTVTDVRVLISNYRVEQGYYYFDDIVLTKAGSGDGGDEPTDPEEPEDPEEPGETVMVNRIENGDFEAGSDKWTLINSSTIATAVVDDPTGANQGKVMKTDANNTSDGGSGNEMFYQTVSTIYPNSDYVLKFKVYCYSTASSSPGFWVTLGTNAITYSTSNVTCSPLEVKTVSSTSSTRVRFTATSTGARNTWVEVQIPFNSGDITSTTITFSNYRANAGQYYFDDIVLEKVGGEPVQPGEPSYDGYLYNGDFETGDGTNWNVTGGTVEQFDGDYALKGTTTDRYDAIATQTITVTPQTDYTLDLKAYYNSTVYTKAKARVHIYAGATADGSELASPIYYWDIPANQWDEHQLTFDSGENTQVTIVLEQQAAENKEDTWDGNVYYDDFVVKKVGGDAPATAGDLVVNGTFETGDNTGWTLYQYTKVNTEAAKTGSYGAYLKGSGSYGSLLQQEVDVVIGKSYVVSFWAKVVTVGFNIQVLDGGKNGTLVDGKWCSADNFTDWTKVSFVVSPTTNTLCLNFCGAGNGSEEIVYIDDVSVTEAPLISNGDFETGDLSSWEKHQSTVISADAAYEGSYGVNLKGNGSWGGMLNQNLPVKDGKTYELSFWYKINQNGFTLQLIGAQTNTMYMNKSYKSPVGEWTQLVVSVTAVGDTAIKLNFSGIGGADANPDLAEDTYIDSITFVELKGASNDGYITNGDFEYKDWTTHWTNVNGSCTVTLVEGHDSAQALSIVAPKWCQVRQKFAVEQNTDYTITLWAKDTTDLTLILKTGTTDENFKQISLSAGSEWTQITYNFNSGDNTSLYLGFMGQESGNGAGIIDDIRIVANKEASFDGYIYNGDFETGMLGAWNSSHGSTAIVNDAHGGIYAASVKGPGDWGGGLMTQEITIEAGKTYTLSFWYKPISNGVNYKLRTPDQSVSFDTLYLDSRKYADWTYHEVTFEAGTATKIEMTFSGSGKGDGTPDEVLIDDVRLVNLSGNEMDRSQLTTNDGASIRDYNDQPALAFRFTLAAEGIEVKNTNVYVKDSGTVKLYKYADVLGELKRFGAVVTNDATVGTDAEKMVRENAAAGSKTIDIDAKYLLDMGDESVSYAVRILSIPNDKVGVEIYARPYYVYELDGATYTIYGDITHNNYADVESTRRTKRVLTIGGDYQDYDDYLYDVLKSAAYDQVILGNVTDGVYAKNDDNGEWKVTSGIDAATAIADERWQYIVVTNDADLAWAEANKPADAQILYYNTDIDNEMDGVDGVVPADATVQSLNTILPDADAAQKEYAVALAWFVTLTGESLDLVGYNAAFSDEANYHMARAAAHAWYAPYAVSDLSEIVLVSGSDFQAPTDERGIEIISELMGSLHNNGGYGMLDGLLFAGDHTVTLGSDYDTSHAGQTKLDTYMTDHANFGKVYTQGNHDADIPGLNPYGNNDPAGAPYGVFVIHEDDYNTSGGGGQKVAQDLTAYFNEKINNGWGNKPIFVISHLPLHYNYRTVKDGSRSGLTAMYMLDAMNAASEAGLNIIYLFGHNHSGGYDDYLGGAAIYVPKGESILVTDPNGYKNAPIETELKFTYMNAGYVSYYNDMGKGADTSLTMSVFRIQANGDVIITRYDKNGVHNLKSAGQLSPYDREYTEYTVADDRVYESSRIVGATKDEEYDG